MATTPRSPPHPPAVPSRTRGSYWTWAPAPLASAPRKTQLQGVFSRTCCRLPPSPAPGWRPVFAPHTLTRCECPAPVLSSGISFCVFYLACFYILRFPLSSIGQIILPVFKFHSIFIVLVVPAKLLRLCLFHSPINLLNLSTSVFFCIFLGINQSISCWNGRWLSFTHK